jgi:hypothetical protein
MKRTVVRYKAKPEMVEENERFIEKVFEELRCIPMPPTAEANPCAA